MAGNTLADVADVVMGQSPVGETVSPLQRGLPLLNGPTEFGPHHPLPVQYTTDARKRCRPGDILFCVRGSTTGRMNWADREYAIGRGIAAIRHRRSAAMQPLVRAVIEYQLPSLLSQATGSTFPNISASQLEALPFLCIPESWQFAIARFLGALDDKIELSRKMSATLEAIARALFKSWFVDFDPVRAKAEGRDPGLPPEIAALFPRGFRASLLGEIPEGWQVCGLDEVAHFLNGLALQKYPPVNGRALPVIKITQLRAGNTVGADRASADLPPEYIVSDGDVLFSWSGSLECVLWTGGPGALNQHLFKASSNSFPKWFYYFWIHRHLEDFRRIAAGKATTMGHIQRHHLSDAKVVIAPAELLTQADRILSPLVERLIAARLESRTLSKLRDMLLPKLIAGEIRLGDAERLVGQSA